MKRAAVIAFTRTGAELGRKVIDLLIKDEKEWEGTLFVPGRIFRGMGTQQKAVPMIPDSHTWIESNWNIYQGFIFVSATGIAVRLIAPCLRDKLTDPAVVVMDERAQFVIPLASGHMGGANALAGRIAAGTGAMPVITTATDVQHKFAVDLFAKKNGLRIMQENRCRAKEITAAVLEGKRVGFYCEYEMQGELPKELTRVGKKAALTEFDYGIVIRKTDARADKKERHEGLLRLMPQDVILGIGCKKGMPAERILEAVAEACRRIGISKKRISQMASISLKAEEAGILETAKALRIPFRTYPAKMLKQITSVSRESDFVKQVTGVGNVCERAALYCAAEGVKNTEAFDAVEILLPKTGFGGITLAVVRKKWSVHFE